MFLYERVLKMKVPWLDGVIRAKRPSRLPVALTHDEVRRIFSRLAKTKWLMAAMLYGSGMRLFESLGIRVKDIDLERRELTVREGKGEKDRRTMISDAAAAVLPEHLKRVKRLHNCDLRRGYGRVNLPYALAGSNGVGTAGSP